MNPKENIKKDEQQQDLGILSDLRKRDVFKTPDGYFDQLGSSIVSKISADSSKNEHAVFAYPRILMAAAVITAFAITGVLYFTNQRQSEVEKVVLTYDDLIQAGMVSQYDNTMLMEHYLSLPKDSGVVEESVSYKKMNDYLIENDIDISLIINEL